MFLRWLSRLLASLLVLLLFIAVFSFVLSQTVFSPAYLRHELTVTDSYNKLASVIDQQIVESNGSQNVSGQSPTPALGQLQNVITGSVVQQKLDSTVEQTKAYYDGKGPLPSLDISDIAGRLQATGVQLPSGTDYTKPIAIKPVSKLKTIKQLVSDGILAGLGVILLLAATLVAIARKRGEYRPLANVFIALTALLGLLAIALLLVPHLTDHLIRAGNSDQLAELARDLANSITHDIGLRLLISALLSLVVGVGGRILIRRLHPNSKAFVPVPDRSTDMLKNPPRQTK